MTSPPKVWKKLRTTVTVVGTVERQLPEGERFPVALMLTVPEETPVNTVWTPGVPTLAIDGFEEVQLTEEVDPQELVMVTLLASKAPLPIIRVKLGGEEEIVQVGLPQFKVPPQPLEIVPQLTPWAEQVVGVQETQETVSKHSVCKFH